MKVTLDIDDKISALSSKETDSLSVGVMAWVLREVLREESRRMAIIFARTCLLLVNLGFWVGSLSGESGGSAIFDLSSLTFVGGGHRNATPRAARAEAGVNWVMPVVTERTSRTHLFPQRTSSHVSVGLVGESVDKKKIRRAAEYFILLLIQKNRFLGKTSARKITASIFGVSIGIQVMYCHDGSGMRAGGEGKNIDIGGLGRRTAPFASKLSIGLSILLHDHGPHIFGLHV
jgi:hypothetical protein